MRLLAFVGLLLLVPGQAAVTVALEYPDAVLEPEVQVMTLLAHVTIDCPSLLLIDDPLDGGHAYHLVIEAPSELLFEGPASRVIDSTGCLTGTLELTDTAQFAVVGTRAAPGLVPIPFSVEARFDGGLPPLEEQSNSAHGNVTLAPFFRLMAQVDQKIQQTAGGPTPFEVALTNFGNTAILVTPEVTEATTPEWLDPIAPFEVAAGERHTLTLVFEVPGPGVWTNEQHAFQIQFTPSAGEQEGDPLQVNLLIRHRGGPFEATPAPSGTAPIALLAAALIVRRLSRQT